MRSNKIYRNSSASARIPVRTIVVVGTACKEFTDTMHQVLFRFSARGGRIGFVGVVVVVVVVVVFDLLFVRVRGTQAIQKVCGLRTANGPITLVLPHGRNRCIHYVYNNKFIQNCDEACRFCCTQVLAAKFCDR